VFPVYVNGQTNCWGSLLCFIEPLSLKKNINFIFMWFWYFIRIWGYLLSVLWEQQLHVRDITHNFTGLYPLPYLLPCRVSWFRFFLAFSPSCWSYLTFVTDIAYYVKYCFTNYRMCQNMVINCSNEEFIGYKCVKICHANSESLFKCVTPCHIFSSFLVDNCNIMPIISEWISLGLGEGLHIAKCLLLTDVYIWHFSDFLFLQNI
jgi:hypothetical protein